MSDTYRVKDEVRKLKHSLYNSVEEGTIGYIEDIDEERVLIRWRGVNGLTVYPIEDLSQVAELVVKKRKQQVKHHPSPFRVLIIICEVCTTPWIVPKERETEFAESDVFRCQHCHQTSPISQEIKEDIRRNLSGKQ